MTSSPFVSVLVTVVSIDSITLAASSRARPLSSAVMSISSVLFMRVFSLAWQALGHQVTLQPLPEAA